VPCPVQDSEIGNADLVWVAIDNCRQAEVSGVHFLFRYVEFIVATMVCFGPLKLTIGRDQIIADVVRGSNGDVLSQRAGTADCGTRKLNADCAGASRRVVWALAQPDKVGDPACEMLVDIPEEVMYESSLGMTVTRDHYVVRNVVVVQGRIRAIAICLIAVPSIVIERIDVAVCEGQVDS
jgi:hypothetical protein